MSHNRTTVSTLQISRDPTRRPGVDSDLTPSLTCGAMLRCVTYTTLALGLSAVGNFAFAETLTFLDPKGDDNGSGKMKYPTGKDYSPGAFDLTKLEIREDGDDVVFEIETAATIT